ncbi:PAX3- and PAX7-binding protein 1-like [Mytilus californianus]|uniref:PAX3- and PAX7-binding protein 1-like n=1 Tax=Mytilus californianus TaxID=6549 RepID=UPI0022481A6C|nr:PAX3- and PAX7-binding protein 1-like [Mytilus californianus]
MATFKKPRRNFRGRKIVTEEESDEEKDEDVQEMEVDEQSNDADGPKLSKKSKKSKKEAKSSLSFVHDLQNEGEEIKIKKSSHSKKLAKMLKKEMQKEKEEVHKVEKIIKQEPVQVEVTFSPKVDRDAHIKKLREELLTLNGEEAEAADNDSEEDEKGAIHKMLGRGQIPDANMIHSIRKQRQQRRDLGDFIPVDDTVKVEKSSSKSRLVREDDNDKSDDDEEGRIDFSVNTFAKERQKIQNDFLAIEHGSDQESDQDKEWEEQQIRKGVNTQGAPGQEEYSYDQYRETSNGYGVYRGEEEQSFKPFKPLTDSQDMSGVTMESLRKRLQERLTSMDEVHRSHVRERDTLETDIEESSTSIDTCKERVKGLEEQYRFFQEMRGYVRDLVECLNEKVPTINDLENKMLILLSNRSERLISRRQQDVRDQCQDYMTSKAKVVMETSEDQERQRRVAEREARRARRRRLRESKDIVGHHDGLSSDDEQNQSEITKFNLEKESIHSGVERLFEDVVEDFSDIHSIRERFEDWRSLYNDTYKEAYIGLCLPKLVNPFVRLQLINWNPLQESCRDFEENSWFDTMLFYGSKIEELVENVDDDVKLLPTIVEKIIQPRLTVFAEKIWDPLSTTQTSRLVNVVQKIINEYPSVHADNKKTQELLRAIVNRMKKTLDDDVFMPLYPKSVTENRGSGSSVFFHRQSWTCIKLLGNILSWHGILSSKVLHSLALDGLLNRYIILGLCNSPIGQETIQKCQSIISTFPKQWFTGLTEDRTMPQLENLCRYLVSIFNSIHIQSRTDFQKMEAKEYAKQISKMLIGVHAMDLVTNLPKVT